MDKMNTTAQSAPKWSFRVEEFAARHSLSRAKVYLELKEGRLRGRKVGAATIITVDDERAWLASLPTTATAA